MIHRRNHVFGQHLADLHTELRYGNLFGSLVEEGDLLLCLVVDDTAVLHEFQRVDNHVLDLTQIGAIAHVLHDVILAALEHDQSLVVVTDDVASTIDEFGIGLVQRVLYESGSRLLGVVVVTHSQRGTTYTEFSLHVGLRHQTVFIVENEDIGIATGVADGQWLFVGYLLINNIIGAVEGDLDGTIEVGEDYLRQVVVPVIELFGGEYLASEPHRTETLEFEGREQVHVGDVHHDGGNPEEEVHLMLLQYLEDLRREGSEMGRQHNEGAGLGHKHAEFKTVDIEHDG